MRSVGLENSVTSLALTTHQATAEQYQRSADEAENFVEESTEPPASPPEEGKTRQANPQEVSSQQATQPKEASSQPRLEEDANLQREENLQPQETGKRLDVRA